jgi:hypothetical protein
MECLQLLILSQDSGLAGLVRAALQNLGVSGSYFETDSARALEVLRSRHFDGIVLECSDLVCAQSLGMHSFALAVSRWKQLSGFNTIYETWF